MIRMMYPTHDVLRTEVHPEVQDSEAGLQRHRTGPSNMVAVSLSAI